MVESEYKRCVHFEDRLKDNLRVLIALQKERKFSILVKKAKIVKKVQALGFGTAQPQRVVQQTLKSRGQARHGNSMGCGQRAPGRGAGQIKPRQFALVYAARHGEDRNAPDVIIGTFLIYDVPYLALIDIGSTHSYAVSTVSENLGILVESTSSEVIVLSPLRYGLVGQAPCQSGMSTKSVVLRTEEDNKGCKAFLASISVSVSGDYIVKDIKTVRDFPDVFPEELPSLPLNREVEFGIEFLLGIVPVSIAPF
ncbi:uncharacterized protein [Gossypium hirsutum]|uniref:Uncharacterized protein n=1 Tax=Gossypium hirsutum TaxID=3635 RepID=A0A1U8PGI8_GOSHI|nr:uncharacterized protein LOC107958886 [Gossypium hirsutum]